MSISNSVELLAADIRETQQPDIWLPQGEFHAGDDKLITILMKETWNRWLAQAITISSPLLQHPVRLLNAEGGVLDEWSGGSGTHEEGEALQAPVCSRTREGDCIARLTVAAPDRTAALLPLLQAGALALQEMYDHAFDLLTVRQVLKRQQISDKEARGRDKLFQAAKRLHDQNDVYSVLHVLLDDVEGMYPGADINLYLSQDFLYADNRVKPLLLRHTNDDLNAEAFLTGRPVSAEEEGGGIRLAIPMRGKQAVYGVLSLSKQQQWDEFEQRSMLMLVDTAGSAFENAKLYEQSNLLISELQLINELTKRLNQSLRLNEVFDFVLTELLQIFKADYCHMMQLSIEDNRFRIVASNIPMEANAIYSTDNGFSGVVVRTREPLIVSDYWSTRIVDSKLMDATGSRSLIAAPVMAGAEVVGVIMVSHLTPNFFSYENYKLLQVLSTHIGLAVANASLHAEVRRMVITDNLTGLHARHFLNEQIQLRQRKDRCGSLVLVDIDHFKRVNDTYGHLVGDSILVLVSDAIRSCIRDTDIAARWGGEELAVYLPRIRTAQALRIAERIRSSVETQTNPPVTVSCGISEWTFEEDKISVESLFNKADMALYEAKKNGRNRICIGDNG
ncbi:diguanylate cyclase domain-containing protein [Paenibacillus lycopersici]|nr:diguanylate cyclase [Paenibacillus lycopersici]